MPKPTLGKLIVQRSAHRKTTTKLLEKIEEAKEFGKRGAEFTKMYETLEAKWSILETLNEKILSLMDEEGMEDEIVETDEYFLELSIQLHKLKEFQQTETATSQLPEQNRLPTERELESAESIVNQLSQQSSVNQQREIVREDNQPTVSNGSLYSSTSLSHKLPKLVLPTFDGSVLQWQTFWDIFETSVHNNPTLSEIQKFSYLKSQLEGVAAMTIEGFSLTNANYSRAVDLLRERYGQPHKIIQSTMQALLQLPTPSLTIPSLRNFHDRMESYIRGLESLNQCQETYGSLLVPILLEKLPGEIRRNIARENEKNDWTLACLRKAINKEINILEAGQCNRVELESQNATAIFHAGTKNKAKDNVDRNKGPKPSSKCAYCNKDHRSFQCKKFATFESRMGEVKKNKLCFNCLGNHQLAECQSKRTCRFCDKKHHSSICAKNPAFQTNNVNSHGTAMMYANNDKPDILLKTAVAEVESSSCSMYANILFDEGAQRSFITQKLADELNVTRRGTDSVRLAAFGGKEQDLTHQHLDRAEIQLITDSDEKLKLDVLIIPTIAVPLQTRAQSRAAELSYLKGLKLAHPVTSESEFEISLLIGVDQYWKIVEDRVIRGNGPTAVKSKIGYLLSGPMQGKQPCQSSSHMMNVITSHASVDRSLEKFWNLESIGITDEPESKNTSHLQKYQSESITFDGERYVAKLPWKDDHPSLPTNYSIAKKRTESTIRRLKENPYIFQKYGEIIADQEKRGFIEKICDTSFPDEPPQRTIHYIPHHAVKKDSATTPVRIVYDCSCKQAQRFPSLNECLNSTPPTLNDLPELLVRFRLNPIAVSTDIEKAFLHVGLHEKDRDATRFFWLSDPNDPDSSLCTYRFKVVLFGATCSPFILNATILKHLESNEESKTADVIKRDLYVDNVISSFVSETEATTYYAESRDLMLKAGFNLRSWTSNCETIRDIARKDNVLDKDNTVKVLGMKWSVNEDCLSYATQPLPQPKDATKRLILKHSSRIYDPLGFLSPVTVKAKILLQLLWKEKLDWDTPLPEGIQSKWTELTKDINEAIKMTFPRRYFDDRKGPENGDMNKKTSLHVFVDASKQAYGAVAYLVRANQSSFIMAKNRVAPVKPLTLPELELMAAVVGSRLATYIVNILQPSEVTVWSDSQIVLYWLYTDKPQKRFIKNRVSEINEKTKGYTWKYCPTQDNPADLLTRGVTSNQFYESTLWRSGPTWMLDRSKWPSWQTQCRKDTCLKNSLETENSDVEQENSKTILCANTTLTEIGLHRIIDIKRYGTYEKLLNTTAFVHRFLKNCRTKEENRIRGRLTVDELHQAEMAWIKNCQETSYGEQITNILCKQKPTAIVKQLRLFLDTHGYIRCGGRIHNAPLPDNTKFPYLLPRKHRFTSLVIQYCHRSVLHDGTNATVTQLRQKFWIPSIRQQVNSELRKCVTCKKVIGKPFRSQTLPPLPKTRVENSPPFTVTGVDFTGALSIKDRTGYQSKAYICLFTCANTRAVHIDVVPDLTEKSFLNVFRRFVSRKSLPKLIVSDNATTYTAAASHINRLFNSESVKQSLTQKGTEWKFIPKRAPWYGGWWERLIGLTKTIVKKVLGRSYLTFDELQTVCAEVEAIMNDRPLTYVFSDPHEPEPVTPSHLLYGRRLSTLPYGGPLLETKTFPKSDCESVRNKSKSATHIIEQFRRRWMNEYLTGLRERYSNTSESFVTIKPGDVVQIHDDKPRLQWRLGVVDELITGNDGITRAVKLRTSNGTTNRPVVKLYPLELKTDEL